jgi:uncharacterized SAM-binding protein YcdF (DUF218 family)
MGPVVRSVKRFLIRGAVILATILLATFALSRLGSFLVLEDPLQKADAIVALGGTMYERQLEAVDLYKAGYAPRIYLSRENPDWGEAELIRRGIPIVRLVDVQVDAMVKLGVPREAIRILDPANSTAQEARFLRDVVTTEKLPRLIIITSKQHTRRARLVLRRRLAGTGATPIVRASRYDRSNVDRWWANRSTMRFTLFESQRLLGYWIGVAD